MAPTQTRTFLVGVHPSSPMQKRNIEYLVFGLLGLMTGMAASMLTCQICTANFGDFLATDPPIAFPIVELVSPILGLLVGLLIARLRQGRKPTPRDRDDAYPPV
jgi:hypothetical protein